uniref:Ig-like domain-containing protein n=1 Tax=Megaselia scalaris TaxID=36166 RepID=T1GBI5_MEGSC
MDYILMIVPLVLLIIESSYGTTMANFDQYSSFNYINSQPTQSDSNAFIERTELIENIENNSNNNNLTNNVSKHYDRGPYFDISASRNVTALVGKTANLNCRIRNLMNRTVSWIRHRDLHLLTVSEATYTSDQRFTCINNKQTGDWTLK